MKRLAAKTILITALVILGAGGQLLANKLSHRIESSAKKSYVFEVYLKDDDVKIKAADDGAVTLTGTVSEWSHRSLAEETAAGLPGVISVDNRLEVAGGQPDEKSDAWIGMKVKTMLMFHRHVSGLNTNVDVKAGIVTLRGQAPSEEQKGLTAEYVKDVEGVQGVDNQLTVDKNATTNIDKMTGHIDDASIKAQVKLTLLFHRSTSTLKTEVDVRDGVVTVRGVARNGAEIDLVGRLVNDIKGVKVLRNKMTIG